MVHNRFIRAFRRQRYKQALRIVPLLYSGPKMLTQSRSTSRLGPMTWAWTIGSGASWSSPKANFPPSGPDTLKLFVGELSQVGGGGRRERLGLDRDEGAEREALGVGGGGGGLVARTAGLELVGGGNAELCHGGDGLLDGGGRVGVGHFDGERGVDEDLNDLDGIYGYGLRS